MSDILLEPYINSLVNMIVNTTGAFDYLDSELKNNKELMCLLVSKSDRFVSKLPAFLLNDKDIALSAVSFQGRTLKYMSDTLKNDVDVVRAAVIQDGWALQYANPVYKSNSQIVELAITEDGTAIRYADPTLQEDRGLVLKAVASNGAAVDYLIDRFKYDREIVRLAVNNKNMHILNQIPDQFTYDLEIVLMALYRSNSNREYIHQSLKDAPEVEFVSKYKFKISELDWPIVCKALVQASDRFFNPPTLLQELTEDLPSKYLILARYALGDNSYIQVQTCDIGDII